VEVPEHIITLEDTLNLARRLRADHPHLPLALRLIRNTGVRKRHIVQPIEKTLSHPGFEARNLIYEREAKQRVPPVIDIALRNAGLGVNDIDLLVYVSCTGFMMPSMTAWLINELGLRSNVIQMPIAQLGCAAGGAAINRAQDFCTAYPHSNALIVSCEFCSLCYQPDDDDVGSLLSDGLFGDAVGAAVVRGSADCDGVQLCSNASYLIPHTADWISYHVKSTGFHFRLDRRVPATMEPIAPVLRTLVEAQGWEVARLGFYIIHAGGPRILDDLSKFLNVDPDAFRYSRATLTEYGNIASAVVLDSLGRCFDDGGTKLGSGGLIAGFGPGITAEMATGIWTAMPDRAIALAGVAAHDPGSSLNQTGGGHWYG
jgi:1,3,6,8-tetrahydroxynaphthalene synthase